MKTNYYFRTWKDDVTDLLTTLVSMFTIAALSLFLTIVIYSICHEHSVISVDWNSVPMAMLGLFFICIAFTNVVFITTVLTKYVKEKTQNKLMKLYADTYKIPFAELDKKGERKEKAYKGYIRSIMFLNSIVPFALVNTLCAKVAQSSNDSTWYLYGATITVIMLAFAFLRYRHIPRNLREFTELFTMALWRY